MKKVNQVKLGDRFLRDEPHRISHDKHLWDARVHRDQVVGEMKEWEQMREIASEIKKHTLSNLDTYLEEFERNATKNGIVVHWAKDAEEHNKIVHDLFVENNVKVVTKGKSMLMDECEMRAFMKKHNVEINEADLGERIQQLDDERASHIVMPAIHKLRSDVAALFAKHLGSDADNDNPHYLNSVMRKDMRSRYKRADAGMTGANFLVAETGGVVVCTNEGNADISANVPSLYIVSAGIEKVIPKLSDLPLFVRMLSRSALGFHITQYTSHFHRPREGQKMHIILVDNGRSDNLVNTDRWEVLKCIRCAACLNTCPVFRRTGGLSYDAAYMGPIGIVLEPSRSLHRYAELPYACTHCGSCGNICPVKVPIPRMVFYWRQQVVREKEDRLTHRMEMNVGKMLLASQNRLKGVGGLARDALRYTPNILMKSQLNPWAYGHGNPEAPKETFRKWYLKNKKNGNI